MLQDLIKLGGSVLTDKSVPLSARSEQIERLAIEIREALPTGRWRSEPGLVLVHGAGSFGHPRAEAAAVPVLPRADAPESTVDGRSGAHNPGSEERHELRENVARIQADLRALHLELVWSLGRAGIPAISLPGFAFLRVRSGRLERPDLTPLLLACAQGFVPVTCGDVILDPARGPWVVSGDRVMVEIARQTAPERTTFVTDVEGVYDRSPTEPGAQLLEELGSSTIAELVLRLERSSPAVPDVTGSMAGKLRALQALAGMGLEARVISGATPGRLGDRLRHREVPGTLVRPDARA